MNGAASPPVDPHWTSRTVDVGRTRLHYLDSGSGDDVLLCLHGTSMTAHCWGHLAASLRSELRVIALDLRGHGASARPASNYTIAEYRDDVVAFAATIGLERFSLLGSSLGTQVAVAVAAAAPAEVERVVLSDPSLFVSDAEILKYLRSHHRRPRSFATRADAESFCRALPQRAGLAPELHELAMVGDFRQDDDGTWAWAYDLEAVTKTFLNLSVDQSADIAGAVAPTLILNAERSNVLSEADARRLEQMFPAAELVRIADCNHTIWGDQPDRLAAETRRFLRLG